MGQSYCWNICLKERNIDGSEGNYFGSKRYQINRKNKIEIKVVNFLHLGKESQDGNIFIYLKRVKNKS